MHIYTYYTTKMLSSEAIYQKNLPFEAQYEVYITITYIDFF